MPGRTAKPRETPNRENVLGKLNRDLARIHAKTERDAQERKHGGPVAGP